MPTRRDLANAIRALSMDAVQRANSGHPGAPMGMADIAEVLWNDYLKHNPANPHWTNRDRFVMSNGHGSMLVYSLLHLTGYDLPLEELENFRQLGSKTAGHPEYGLTPGIETTTGPLGQGLANAVGMALAETVLAARFNRADFPIVDHYTWVFVGDGCLMEGISHEVCSYAGTLGLGKLIVFYDDNGISIDGETKGWFTDDTPKRFEAYGWHVVPDVDGHDPDAVNAAIEAARAETGKPSIICCRTIIGYGSPNKQGTADTHGAPLGEDEVKLARESLGWTHEPFVVPDELRAVWNHGEEGAAAEAQWRGLFGRYRDAHPELAAEYERRLGAELPAGWAEHAERFISETQNDAKSMATRKASLHALNGYGPLLPELVGGSADLTGSNNTFWSGSKTITRDDPDGNYLFFGVREFGMCALVNGMALYGGFIPYAGTFLVFSDYARNAVRMSALIGAPGIFVWTHDSIGLGEDGPTHQPIEHLTGLRIMPNMSVWRPCDATETGVAWRAAIERRDGPTSLVLSRQGLPHQTRNATQVESIERGGYVLYEPEDTPELIFIATGSEVGLAMEAAGVLASEGIAARVVSMPNAGVFDAQDVAYQLQVLPPQIDRRIAVEAGVPDYWYRYVGPNGRVIGLQRYGESAPAKDVFAHLGLTVERLVSTAREIIPTTA